MSQAIHVAARLDLTDALAHDARTSDELAAEKGADARSLYRLMRALASFDVLREENDGRFALTPLGECLRSDAPESLGGWAAFVIRRVVRRRRVRARGCHNPRERHQHHRSSTVTPVKALVLQHIACEPPGVYEDVLRERGVSLHRVEVDEGESLPDWRSFDAIVAMGGPMSATDDAELPWLTAEKRLIADAVGAGLPFWGVCLGVQLLAASLGARVYAGGAPEVGILPVTITREGREDPVFGSLPDEVLTLQWHDDTFDLPAGALRLAGSPAYPNQAFRAGRAYGVQFHLEVSPQMAREWAQVPEYAASLERVLGPGALDDLIARLDAHAVLMLGHGRALFERWLALVRDPAAITVSLP